MKLNIFSIEERVKELVEKEVYTSYLEPSNRFDRFNKGTGILKVKLIDYEERHFGPNYKFEVGKKYKEGLILDA